MREVPGFSSLLGSYKIKKEVASMHGRHLPRYDFECKLNKQGDNIQP